MEIDALAANRITARTSGAPAPALPPSAPMPLDYAGRLPSRWPRLIAVWGRIRDLGPLFPWPANLPSTHTT